MKQETIEKATKVINRNIKFYSRQLKYFKLKMKPKETKETEIILSDLKAIKRAVLNNETSVPIIGTEDRNDFVYNKTLNVLQKAGFDYDGDGFCTLYLIPIDEFEYDEFEYDEED